MNGHRGIIFVLLLIILISIIYWAVVYNILHQPEIPVERDIFALKEPRVHVRLIHTVDSLNLELRADWHLAAGAAQPKMDLPRGSQLSIVALKNNLLITSNKFSGDWMADTLFLSGTEHGAELAIANVPFGIGWSWAGKEKRIYSGQLRITTTTQGHLHGVDNLPLEEYLRGVVPYEIGKDAPFAALQAQAIAARSEAVMALREKVYRGPGYDLTADVMCQVFGGTGRRTALVDSAIASTSGVVLYSGDRPIHAYYSANCGGHSEKIANVWPERDRPAPYLSGHFDTRQRIPIKLTGEKKIARWLASDPDVYCNPSHYPKLSTGSGKHFRWQQKITRAALSELVAQKKQIGRISEIKILKRGVSGRVIELAFIGEDDSLVVRSELAIRQIWQPPLRSACFVVHEQDGIFTLDGAGWGHGVGMCQTGAITQASLGISYKQILQHYYRGSQLRMLY